MNSIPVLAVTSDSDNELLSGRLSFNGTAPVISDMEPFITSVQRIVSSFEEKRPVLVIDVKGLQKKNINSVLLKKLRIRGAETWFMTNIESADDVFDAFNTDAHHVLMPCHTVRSIGELQDILDVSDSIIPVLFVRNGRVRFISKDIEPDILAEDLFEMGFAVISVFDLDHTVSPTIWNRMRTAGKVIPYVQSGNTPEGFEYCFTDRP